MVLTLYSIVALAWLAVAAYASSALVSIFTGTRRYGDGARLMVLAWSLLMVGFIGRRAVLERTSDPAIVALLVASLVIAFFTWRTARLYGRGWRV